MTLTESALIEVTLPAAYLHDLVNLPKNDLRRKEASKMSADAAALFLREITYPEQYISQICHCIEAHSFSAQIKPLSLEAKIVQDADRLDALGAVGIARCFSVGALMGRPFYDESDCFHVQRELDDRKNTLDHFYVKLFEIPKTLNTVSAQKEAEMRIDFMRKFVDQLSYEISDSK